MQRYPENPTVGVEDFRRSGWKAAIASSGRDVYFSMWRGLHAAAKAAVESGNLPEGKLLWLLADACSFRLDPRSLNEPFHSRFSEAPVVDCFQVSDIDLFAQIVEEVDDAWLQARLADLVWLLGRPRNPKHALLAIDAYRKLDLGKETWMGGGEECWERAINLARSLRSGAGDRLEQMEKSVLVAFDAAGEKDGFLAFWLSELLFEHSLGKSQSALLAERLQSIGKHFDSEGELIRARQYFHASFKWYKLSGDKETAAKMILCKAETCIKEAEAKKSADRPSHAAAHYSYENAIHILREIPHTQRKRLGVDERLLEVQRQMRDAGERAVEEMKLSKGPTFDPSEMIHDARKAVTGKPTDEALLALASIVPFFRKEELRERAKEVLELQETARALAPTIHMVSSGRVIAKQVDPKDNEPEALLAAMVKEYTTNIVILVQGRIVPALEIINLEHRLREADFVWLAEQSPIVPHDRERLFGKALFLGYDRDFVGALHVLIPQIEEMVRSRLRFAGANTTNVDPLGIEKEIGLSSLVKLPEMVQAFGEDLSFEIEALFCHQLGPNLRNNLAHGLLDYGACESFASVYAWWLGLRIVLQDFRNSRRNASVPAEANGRC